LTFLCLRRAAAAAVVAVSLGACAQPGAPPACTAPLKPAVQVDLYFGRDKQGGGEVSGAEWAAFLNEVVTPRFPDGLSVLEVEGQVREPSGAILRERSKLLIVVVFDAPAHAAKVGEIVADYSRRFGQHSVFRSERAVCAGL
jgi:hypothetical protein